MYKPNFCADCGARVERARWWWWRAWMSGGFCRPCARRFRGRQILSTALGAATLFSLGLVCGRFQRPSPPPLIVERGELPAAPTPLSAKDAANTAETDNGTDTTVTAATAAPQPEPVYGPDGTARERPTDPNETVSICGARTQKGTPCRRRVRGTGRCWQHKGLPAMLPPDKLIVRE